jgi:hypothetical protein
MVFVQQHELLAARSAAIPPLFLVTCVDAQHGVKCPRLWRSDLNGHEIRCTCVCHSPRLGSRKKTIAERKPKKKSSKEEAAAAGLDAQQQAFVDSKQQQSLRLGRAKE